MRCCEVSLSLCVSLCFVSLSVSRGVFFYHARVCKCASLSLSLSFSRREGDGRRDDESEFFPFFCVLCATLEKTLRKMCSLFCSSFSLNKRFNPKPNRGFLCRVSGRFQRLAMASDHHGPSGYVVRGRFLHGDDDFSERLPEQTAGREV